MMDGKSFKKMTAKRKRMKKVDLLIMAIGLLALWLLLILILSFYHIRNNANEKLEMKTSDSAALHEKDKTEIYFKLLEPSYRANKSSTHIDGKAEALPYQQTRDEFLPTMDSLFQERELRRKHTETLFDDRRRLKESDSMHSTFGKEVVFIYHSHSREAFLPYFKSNWQPEEAYHSKANITLVGKMLGKALERRGVGTIVDKSDIVQELDERGMDYGSSYTLAREHVQAAQKKNRDLEIFLDIHRDSLRKDSTTVDFNGETYARLLFVIGTGHHNFEKNLDFAETLHNLLTSSNPGISKGIMKKDRSQGNGVYNQDLAPNSVIIEIGGVDNTAEEISRTIEALANVLSDYYGHREK